MDANCKIELLGGLRVLRQRRDITRFPTRQTAAVLAYLAFYREQSHPRDILMEVAWPAAAGVSDRHKLRVALTTLRRQLEPPGLPAGTVLLADRQTVQLNPRAVTTDVGEFEAALHAAARARSRAEQTQHLMQAVAGYRGELLPGCLDDWVAPERQRLADAFFEAAGRLTTCLEASGDLERAIDYARQAVSVDPLREEAHQELIRLLGAAGRPEAARRQFAELERRLADGLGVTPAPASLELRRQLERGVGQEQPSERPGGQGVGIGVPGYRRASESDPAGRGARLPAGTITFVLAAPAESDGRAAPAAATASIALLAETLRRYGGDLSEDGSLVAVFPRPSAAAAAAARGMTAAASPSGPPHSAFLPRVALHTGEVDPASEQYQGRTLDRTVRLLRAAHPGQILCSEATAALLLSQAEPGKPGYPLTDLGAYRWDEEEEDTACSHRLFQLNYAGMALREFPPPRATPAYMGSLPLQLTRFFGREQERERLRELLLDEERRLVTVTGPGGSGKTRLVMESTAAVQRRGGRASASGEAPYVGCWFVPLVDLTDPHRIPEKILTALSLPRIPQLEPLDQLVEFLSSSQFAGAQTLLLILDNFEQLTPSGLGLLSTLLSRVPALRLLVTSRQRLDLPGEREFPLAPLPVPAPPNQNPPSPIPNLPTLTACPSVQLFLDRAQAVRPDFQITPQNAAAVAALCTRLEGLPLAIELAAARAQVLTPAQMLSGLEDRFTLLTRRRPGGVPRHQSLWAALAGSYALLSPPLQRFFARLSVFRGGWTAAAAEAICGAGGAEGAFWGPVPGGALDYLTQLRSCSLVLLEEGGAGPELRYRLLETLREFAAEQLSRDEQQTLARRHAQYFADFAEYAELRLSGPEQITWLDRLETEHPNLRAALAWSLEVDGSVDLALRLCAALQPFWHRRLHDLEGLHLAEQALERSHARPGSATPRLHARAMACTGELSHSAAGLVHSRLATERARTLFQQALSLARELDEPSIAARCLTGLAGTAETLDGWPGFQAAMRFHEQALAIYRELGDRSATAAALSWRAFVTYQEGKEEQARGPAEEALAIARDLGDWWLQEKALGVLGRVAHRKGELALARSIREEGLFLLKEIGSRRGQPQVYNHLAQIAFDQGDDPTAQAHYEEAVSSARESAAYRFDLAFGLCGLGDVARRRGSHTDARCFHEECWPMFHQFGYLLGAVHSLIALGEVSRRAGDLAAARAFLRQTLTIIQEWPNERKTIECLEELVELLAAEGREEPAARLLAAAATLREAAVFDPRPTPGHPRYPRTPPDALARRLQAACPAAWADGQTMGKQAAIDHALQHVSLA